MIAGQSLHLQTTDYQFDGLGRQVAVTTHPDAIHADTKQTFYDGFDNVAGTEDASGNVVSFGFDALNQRTSETDPPIQLLVNSQWIDGSAPVTDWSYDSEGDLVSTTDPAGDTTVNHYDALQERTQVDDPRGGITRTAYDPAGDAIRVKDADGNQTQFQFDGFGEQIAKIDPLGYVSQSIYNADGQVTEAIDRDSRRKDYQHDDLGRETGELWYATVASSTPVDARSFGFDAAGDMTSDADNAASDTFAYNALGQETSETQTLAVETLPGEPIEPNAAPAVVTLGFDYDASGEKVLQTDPWSTTLSQYDSAGELVDRSLTQPGGQMLDVQPTWTPRGELQSLDRLEGTTSSALVSKLASDFQYDGMGRMEAQSDVLPASGGGSGSELNLGYYQFDVAGRLDEQQFNGVTTDYHYDPDSELTGDGSNNHSFDLEGNRTDAGSVTGADNRLLADANWVYSYDPQGDLIQKTSTQTVVWHGQTIAQQIWNYSYDESDHLTRAHLDIYMASGAVQSSDVGYDYDALDQRTERQSWTTTTTDQASQSSSLQDSRYVQLDGSVLADLDGASGNVFQREYLRSDAIDQLFARADTAGDARFYATDRLGSVRDLIDGQQQIRLAQDYDAFGSILSRTGDDAERFGYTGLPRDPVTGLDDNRARQYDPTLERFISQDPTGFGGGDVNLYRYGENQPTNATDPMGLASEPVGHHWVPQSVVDDPAIRPRLSDEAWLAAKGAYSGAIDPSHNARAMGSISHVDYTAMLKENLLAYLEKHDFTAGNKMPEKDMEVFIARVRSGRDYVGHVDERIKAFNDAIKSARKDFLKRNPLTEAAPADTLETWIERGRRYTGGASYLTSVAVAALSTLLWQCVGEAQASMDQAAKSPYFRRGVQALSQGDLNEAEKAFFGDDPSRCSGFFGELNDNVSYAAASHFAKAWDIAKKQAMDRAQAARDYH